MEITQRLIQQFDNKRLKARMRGDKTFTFGRGEIKGVKVKWVYDVKTGEPLGGQRVY